MNERELIGVELNHYLFNRFDVARDCIIHTMFVDSNDPELERKKHCIECCEMKCLKYKDYKKIK